MGSALGSGEGLGLRRATASPRVPSRGLADFGVGSSPSISGKPDSWGVLVMRLETVWDPWPAYSPRLHSQGDRVRLVFVLSPMWCFTT